ncbi:MAG: ribonuclease Z [Candidatus Nanoarchaeia archaeon]
MKIPITFLGTGQAVPTAKRNHTSMLLSYKDENILVDCGEGTQRQIRIAKINPCSITKILITHWHGDHILGLPGLLQTLVLNNYTKELNIYIPEGTRYHFDMIFKMFVFTGSINVKVHEVKGKFFENKDFELHAVTLEHGTKCNGYIFEEKDKLRIDKKKLKKLKIKREDEKKLSELSKGNDIELNGKKIKAKDLTYFEKGKKISFVFDTKKTKNIDCLAKDADVMIIESSYSEKDIELANEYNHMTATQAANIAKKQGTKMLILTHISQRYSQDESIILKEAKKEFKNTILAHDFMRVEI